MTSAQRAARLVAGLAVFLALGCARLSQSQFEAMTPAVTQLLREMPLDSMCGSRCTTLLVDRQVLAAQPRSDRPQSTAGVLAFAVGDTVPLGGRSAHFVDARPGRSLGRDSVLVTLFIAGKASSSRVPLVLLVAGHPPVWVAARGTVERRGNSWSAVYEGYFEP
jgi:hypothetical protein